MSDISIHSLIKKGATNTSTLEAIARELEVPVGTFFDGDAGAKGGVTAGTEKGHNASLSRGGGPGIKGTTRDQRMVNSQDENLTEVIREKDRQIEKLLSLIEKLTNK
jgi:hypothetical protein